MAPVDYVSFSYVVMKGLFYSVMHTPGLVPLFGNVYGGLVGVTTFFFIVWLLWLWVERSRREKRDRRQRERIHMQSVSVADPPQPGQDSGHAMFQPSAPHPHPLQPGQTQTVNPDLHQNSQPPQYPEQATGQGARINGRGTGHLGQPCPEAGVPGAENSSRPQSPKGDWDRDEFTAAAKSGGKRKAPAPPSGAQGQAGHNHLHQGQGRPSKTHESGAALVHITGEVKPKEVLAKMFKQGEEKVKEFIDEKLKQQTKSKTDKNKESKNSNDTFERKKAETRTDKKSTENTSKERERAAPAEAYSNLSNQERGRGYTNLQDAQTAKPSENNPQKDVEKKQQSPESRELPLTPPELERQARQKTADDDEVYHVIEDSEEHGGNVYTAPEGSSDYGNDYTPLAIPTDNDGYLVPVSEHIFEHRH